MKPKNLIWIVLGVIAVVIVGWNLFKPAGGGISNVDAAGAQTAIEQGAQVIDVRTAGEYQLGHLPGAVNVPLDQLETQSASWDKNATYLVYCATGARSASAVDMMKAAGFTSIRHFNAGIQAWTGELEKGSVSSSQKIETNGTPVMIEFFTTS